MENPNDEKRGYTQKYQTNSKVKSGRHRCIFNTFFPYWRYKAINNSHCVSNFSLSLGGSNYPYSTSHAEDWQLGVTFFFKASGKSSPSKTEAVSVHF